MPVEGATNMVPTTARDPDRYPRGRERLALHDRLVFGFKWMKETHDLLANLMLALVGLHVIGVIHVCWWHRKNLVLSMVTRRKRDG